MARIVETDNFGGDYPDEKWVLFPMREDLAKEITKLINKAAGTESRRFWKVVDSKYELQVGFYEGEI
jgi:hypothetical protein